MTKVNTTSPATVVTPTLFSRAKGVGQFLYGDWAETVGQECYQARKAGNATLFSFDWKKSYDTFQANKVKDVTQTTTKTATKAAKRAARKAANTATKTGFFGKIGQYLGKIPGAKFIGKHFIPLLILTTTTLAIIKAFNEGGLIEAGKETGRSACDFLGYIGGTIAATAICGFTGFVPLFIAGIAGGFGGSWMGKKVFGKALTEQKEEAMLAAQQQQQQIMQPQQQSNQSAPMYPCRYNYAPSFAGTYGQNRYENMNTFTHPRTLQDIDRNINTIKQNIDRICMSS